jgi:divalent metal cation (Fe/Co/Zn/Cd) transporter
MIVWTAIYLAVVMAGLAGFVARMAFRLRHDLHPQSLRAAAALSTGCIATAGLMLAIAMASHA